MADYAADQTDKLIEKVEKKLEKLYGQSGKEMNGKLKDFLKSYNAENKLKLKDLKAGKITDDQYSNWLATKAFQKQWMQQMVDQLVNDATLTDIKAMSIVNVFTPEAYAINHNFAAFQIEKGALVDTSFTLVDAHTVENLVKNKPNLLPKPDPSIPKEQKWHKQKITDAITQGILQGEDIDDISKRLESVTDMDHRSAVRNARTAMTGAQNAGRVDAYEYAESLGIDMEQEWLATLDERTRDTHRMLDGERVKVGEKFSNGLRYPGDPLGDPEEVYNCRCTLVAAVAGHDQSKAPRNDKLEGMSYEEWKFNHDDVKQYSYYVDKSKDEINKIGGNKTYSGIWKDDVKLSDYESKKDSIQAKMDYYDSEIDKLQQKKDDGTINSWEEKKLDNLIQHKSDLEEFEKLGPQYQQAAEELKEYQEKLAEARAAAGDTSVFGSDAYSKERKDAANWFTAANGGKPAADREFRDQCGEVWRNATPAERKAIYEYTRSYHKYNEPLRGIEYGSSKYVGVGNVDLDKIGVNYGGYKPGQIRKEINDITDIIDKSPLEHDTWFNRGCGYSGMDKFFQCDMDLLRFGSQSDLENTLLGKTVTEYGFMSTSSAKGKGFSGDIIMNIYAPEGTKAMYVEPFSAFGQGGGLSWNGISKQSSFGDEFETLFQQGTEMRIAKVERVGGRIYVDLDVIGQEPQR